MKLETIIADFLEHKSLAPAETSRAYRNDLAKIVRFLAEHHSLAPSSLMPHHLTRVALERWRDVLIDRDESPATIRRRFATLGAFFQFAGDKYALPNRAAKIRKPDLEAPRFKGLSDAEYARMLELAAHLEPRDRFAVELLAMTGLRRSEALGITLSQLSEDWRFIKKVRGKGRKLRTVPVSSELARSMTRYFEWRRAYPMTGVFPLLLSDSRAKSAFPNTWRVDAKTLWRVVHRLLLDAGVSPELCHPHTLRHTYARRKLEQLGQKVSTATALTIVSQLLGHSKLETTLLYLRNDEDEIYELLRDEVG